MYHLSYTSYSKGHSTGLQWSMARCVGLSRWHMNILFLCKGYAQSVTSVGTSVSGPPLIKEWRSHVPHLNGGAVENACFKIYGSDRGSCIQRWGPWPVNVAAAGMLDPRSHVPTNQTHHLSCRYSRNCRKSPLKRFSSKMHGVFEG